MQEEQVPQPQQPRPVPAAPTPDPVAAAPTPPPSNIGNTSGQGSSAAVPPEVKGWSWGAFFLNWIWGIANSVWLALLMFVPVANWVMPFILGVKGKEWAWQAKRWESIEHFKKTQHKWDVAGIIIGVLVLLVIPIILVLIVVVAINPVERVRIQKEREQQLQQQKMQLQQQNYEFNQP